MVTVLYADTSAVISAYLADEPGHAELSELLFGRKHIVLTSELTRIEFASAMTAAKRDGRISDARVFLDRFDADSGPGESLTVLPLTMTKVLPAARRLVLDSQPLRMLGAMHLAVLMRDAAELIDGEPVVLVTRDVRQAEAAKANGVEVR